MAEEHVGDGVAALFARDEHVEHGGKIVLFPRHGDGPAIEQDHHRLGIGGEDALTSSS